MSKLNMCAWSTSTCEIDLSSTSTALLSSFFSRVSSCEESVIQVIWQWTYWDMFTGHFVSQTETANRNKIVKAWRECEEILHTLRDHHTKVLHGGPLECIAEKWQDKQITCIFFTNLVQTLVSLRTYKSAQMVEVLLLNRVLRSIVSDSKGLTAGKWVLSRGSLHSSSCCFMNFLSLHGFTCSTRPWKELWRRFLSPAKKNRLWTWSETLRCVNF